ncbi:5-dehydro-4-deoxyglucarate dehydratase [Kitasatospora sp. NPDC085879]|uniref:5-dehydro-4-deoxyglucarate dehydratase n=1 Tax=Kitasatospora sp. NPDC085879 TaxID=3154769 RepID=UPI000BB1576E|nr:5-dehydro-4-deoxyglucarate dehydratase [Streptomyces sp. TLI_235]PBC71388.1 5-dehydro-4-deoxyglucarate dehydratase [Streptomyces sp. TLI_235]
MPDGPLFFPVTPFGPDGEIATGVYTEHLETGIAAGPGAVFAACGTGEFHALDPDEHLRLVRTAVRAAAGRLPVYAGTGGPLPTARALARAAAEAGADGLLLMPPPLVQPPQAGLVAYTRQVAEAGGLPLIAYHRGTGRLDVGTAVELALLPHVAGIKDGCGDLELLARMITAVDEALRPSGKPFRFFNGLPTAEATAPAYRGLGVRHYSSASFAFVPEIALAFHRALAAGDETRIGRLLAAFYLPLAELRTEVPGYAVSLVKAGVRQRGLAVGGVRPPLTDPTPEHLDRLRAITAAGLAALAEGPDR